MPRAVAQVCLAGPWPAHQHDVLCGVYEVSFVQAFDQDPVNRGRVEVEPQQVAVDGEPGGLHLVGLCAYLPFGGLCL